MQSCVDTVMSLPSLPPSKGVIHSRKAVLDVCAKTLHSIGFPQAY